ncbi:MAG: histidine phosphatase family protein [Burkholderiales bacterium]|nr:MAG: histidine phosphatase family protein [Burkholderiales bacterium]TAG84260.1 MAG: histidine phosphatase family protein [Betaproteobacteria bacterium]
MRLQFWSALLASVFLCANTHAITQTQLFDALRGGGHVLLLRHSQTDPGIGDPAHFKLGDCATQRNLSAEGRAQSKRIADALATHTVRFTRVLSSQWCRCRDTASAFTSQVEDFPALNSFFEDRATEPRQTREVRTRLQRMPANEAWLLVTHQVNISALTGVTPAMGEGVVVKVTGGQWRVLGNLRL